MSIECETRDTPIWRVQMRGASDEEMALGLDALRSLAAVLDEAAAAEHCRVLLLEGASGVFCRGMDLSQIAAGSAAADGIQTYARVLNALRTSPKAVVAAVDGVVLGGGVGLAAAADVVVATERSSFGLPEVMLGILPAMVLPVLIDRVGPARARLLAMTANSIEAAEARACGLVDQTVADTAALGRALRRQIKSLLRAKPAALARLKRHLGEIGTMEANDAMRHGAALTTELVDDPENVAAIAAFVQGDLPSWVRGLEGWSWP